MAIAFGCYISSHLQEASADWADALPGSIQQHLGKSGRVARNSFRPSVQRTKRDCLAHMQNCTHDLRNASKEKTGN